MSLYNMIAGVNPLAQYCVAILQEAGKLDPPRFRDSYLDVEDGGEVKIVVLTRSGGGNRDDYHGSNEAMANHPCYISDEDDDFDSTYAYFYFSVPEPRQHEVREIIKKITEHGGSVNSPSLQEKFLSAIEAIKGEA